MLNNSVDHDENSRDFKDYFSLKLISTPDPVTSSTSNPNEFQPFIDEVLADSKRIRLLEVLLDNHLTELLRRVWAGQAEVTESEFKNRIPMFLRHKIVKYRELPTSHPIIKTRVYSFEAGVNVDKLRSEFEAARSERAETPKVKSKAVKSRQPDPNDSSFLIQAFQKIRPDARFSHFRLVKLMAERGEITNSEASEATGELPQTTRAQLGKLKSIGIAEREKREKIFFSLLPSITETQIAALERIVTQPSQPDVYPKTVESSESVPSQQGFEAVNVDQFAADIKQESQPSLDDLPALPNRLPELNPNWTLQTQEIWVRMVYCVAELRKSATIKTTNK